MVAEMTADQQRIHTASASAATPEHAQGTPAGTTYPLQGAIWPQAGISTEIPAHFHVRGPVGMSLTHGGADFSAGGYLATGPYFNVFNIGKWRRHCGELPLQLRLSGHGQFLLSIRLAGRNMSEQQLFSEPVTLDGEFVQPIDPEDLDHLHAVLLFELTALEDGHLDDFAWVTTAPPRRTPDLMLSVTTFRREEAARRTVDRFRRFRTESALRDHVRMLVVDNGRSLTVGAGDGVEIIENENLGGAGGFTRGLLAAQETGATHCLFMDDDATIQMEAISRTWWFLAYALDPRTTVAGGMIDAVHRWRLAEAGATFELGCRPRFGGLDLRDRDLVFEMEYETTDPGPGDLYGGWWFFAFPVDRVQYLPFPFFVRGDDVSFSLANDFSVVTLPGVASVQESFTDKASPLNWYLDFRSHLAHHLSLPDKRRSWWQLQRMVFDFYTRTVRRFHYDSLAAVNLAFEDVLAGPGFFDRNADMAQRRADLKAMTTTEAWQEVSPPPKARAVRLPRPLRALMRMTLNGHLLPIGDDVGLGLTLVAPYREDFRKAYGASRITYLSADETKAYTVRRDSRRFWHESRRLLRNTLRLRRSYRRTLRQWHTGYGRLTSHEYWERKLGLAGR
jgi:galactofuranosylgalactofuranosylrhamnosyl-N-acetylglucosaminyl-diphospho-decaprenol beta-1,5/1,6-galactofuranosyltransferase